MTYENLPVRDPELGHVVADPGLPEHVERYNEVDEAAGNRAYAAVLAMFAAVPVLAVLFVVIYFAVPRDAYIDFGWLQASACSPPRACRAAPSRARRNRASPAGGQRSAPSARGCRRASRAMSRCGEAMRQV